MQDSEHHLIWNMTRRCNFRCKYCYFPHQSLPEPDPITAGEIGSFLDASGHDWVVEMSGGEPFIYPDFAKVCSRITRKHRIALDSNLSLTKEIDRFSRMVDPAKVVDIYAAVHIEERERLGLVEQFITDVLLLKSRGFMVSVNYVIHPTLLDRYEADREHFAKNGIRLLPRPFKGVHQGVDYPAGYGEAARSLFAKKLKAGKKAVFNFQGIPCEAGHRLVRLEPDRSILRCSGDRSLLGRLGQKVQLHDFPQPCRVPRCPCFGPDYVRLNPKQEMFLEGLTHMLAGDPQEVAAGIFEKVLAGDDESSNAMNNLAVLRMRQGRETEALELLTRAFNKNPFNKVYVLNAAAARASSGDLSAAMDMCSGFLKQHEDRNVRELLNKLESGADVDFPGRVCVDMLPADNPADLYPGLAQ